MTIGAQTGSDTDALPRYDELPLAPFGGRTAWHMFGSSDSVGTLNLLTPARVLDAAKCIRRGEVFALNASLMEFDPPLNPSRSTPTHEAIHETVGDAEGFDDVIHNLYPQVSSQWDSLAHIAYRKGTFYNGVSAEGVKETGANTIDHWARRGIAGRAVLLDADRALGGIAEDALAISTADLEKIRRDQSIEYSPGCILLVRTGFITWYRGLDSRARSTLPGSLRAPGLEHTEEMARYLWDNRISAVASDTFAVEVWPPDRTPTAQPFGFLHQVLIGLFGMALGELWDLDALAASSAADGHYDSMLVSAPLNLPGGIGSPANVVAIK